MLATGTPGAHLPIAGVRASWPHATTPNEFPTGPWDDAWWTSVTLRTPGVVRSAASTGTWTEGTCAEAGQFDVEKPQNGSARVPSSCASSAGTAGGGDGAECPDRGAGHEEGDHEPADEPEGRLGIVEEPVAGDKGRRTAGPVGHEPRTRGREPRSSENQPHDKEHVARQQFEKLAADGARLAGLVEVREHGDTGEERDDPHDPRWAGRRSPLHAER